MTVDEVGTGGWSSYLRDFHAAHARITEDVLGRCRDGDLDPYRWCVLPLPSSREPVVDVACGSGPLADHLDGWIGIDTSPDELLAARELGRVRAVRSSATALPVRSGGTAVAACSMGMQVVTPLADALAELARILVPGGRAVLLLPATKPLPLVQALLWMRVQLALRSAIRYANDEELRPGTFERVVADAGFALVEDERRPFSLPLRDRADVDRLLESLYLPDLRGRRREAARRVLERRIGASVTVPLRRVVLDRAAGR